MASLALGAIGAIAGGFLGGPIGASIGWALGSALGSSLDPQQIQGPRLSDLKLQNSTYGGMIPIPFGAIRIAGNVIWQTDLEEVEHSEGGKGGPEVTSYTYQASFAIRVCEGPVVGIRKMWADGRLIYDATTGASVRSLPVTIYTGTEDQEPDPTMETHLGTGNVPAHRGLAYVVFTDLDLTEFANRIPSFTFEVMERGNTDGALRTHQIEDGLPIRFKSSYGTFNGEPIILQWPQAGIIRVTADGSSTVWEYNSTDLSYIGTSVRTLLEAYPTKLLVDCTPNGSYYYPAIGQYLTNGTYIPIWMANATYGAVVSATGVKPPIGGVAVFQGASGYPESTVNLCYVAGVPEGRYVGGAALSTDCKILYVFTSPTIASSGAVIDTWHKIVDSVVVATGTITPALTWTDINAGNDAGNSINVENNGQWIWYLPANAGARCYTFDESGNMAYYATGGIVGAVEHGAEGSTPSGSIRSFQPGYAGAVFNMTLVIYTRFPAGEVLSAPLDEVVAALCERAGLLTSQIDVTDLERDYVDGYVIAAQSPVRAAIEPLQIAYRFDAVESDGQIKFRKRSSVSVATIADDELAAHSGGGSSAPLTLRRTQEADLPRVVNVNYLNNEADYQVGTQLEQRQATVSDKVAAFEVPIAMPDRFAKQIASNVLYSAWVERERFTFAVGRKYEYLEPTDTVSVKGRTLRLLSKRRSADRVIEFDAVKSTALLSVAGSVGVASDGYVPPVITPDQQSDLLLLDIPLLTDDGPEHGVYAATTPQLAPAPWNGVSIFKSSDGGINYSSILDNRVRGTVGTCGTTLGTFSGGNAFDELNTLSVTLSLGSGTLSSATELAVLGGANLAIVGSEVLQFKNATLVSGTTYTLSGFLRGRRGTEHYIATHAASERFTLASTAFPMPLPNAEVGLARYYRAVPAGKPLSWSTPQSFTNTAQTKRQYTPVQLGGGRDASNNLTLTWVRRARIGGAWVDYVDVPAPPEGEFYDVVIYSSNTYATVKRTTIVPAATYLVYTAAEQTTDFGSTQSTVYWTVGQRDYYGRSVAVRGAT